MAGLVHALQAHALLLAVVLPVMIRLVGHWLPEEPLMVAMGAVAAQSAPARAALLLVTLWASHTATDYAVFSLGRLMAPRLDRWPRVARKVRPVADRVARSRWTLAALIPVRVFPVGRGAWLFGYGLAGVRGVAFVVVDAAAVALFLLMWCGLGWLAGPWVGLRFSLSRPMALWLGAGLVAIVLCALACKHLGSCAGSRSTG